MDALVADAHLPNALAGIRALGRAGVRVQAAAPSRGAAGLWSRYAADRWLSPDSLTDPEAFVQAVGERARERGPLVAYVGQEASLGALLGAWDELPDELVMPYPSPAAVERLRNKAGLAQLAGEHGLTTPPTLARGTARELRQMDIAAAIVKPELASAAFPTARRAQGRAEIEALLDDAPPEQPLLVQEALEGELFSLAVVVDRDGRVLAAFQERALRTWPLAAGSFAATVSEALDSHLADRAALMLGSVGYCGLAQLDFVRQDDAVFVLDVNPRFYACMPLASACGVNLPAAWHAVVERSDPPASPPSYPVGAAYRWLEGDLYAARHGHPGRLFRREPGTCAGSAWSADDPLAAVAVALGTVSLPVRRRMRAWRR